MRWARTARRASPAGRSCSPWSTRRGARFRAFARPCSASSMTINARARLAALYVSSTSAACRLRRHESGLDALLAEAPPTPGREPLRLVNHGPFHTPSDAGSSDRALPASRRLVRLAGLPMVDGRGHIWRPFASDAEALRHYTFATQILEPYDFTRAVQVAVREYAPDRIILLGPGDTLGGAIAQALIAIEWRGLQLEAGLSGDAGRRAVAALHGPRGPARAGHGPKPRLHRAIRGGRRPRGSGPLSRNRRDQSLLIAPLMAPLPPGPRP